MRDRVNFFGSLGRRQEQSGQVRSGQREVRRVWETTRALCPRAVMIVDGVVCMGAKRGRRQRGIFIEEESDRLKKIKKTK